MAVHDIFSKRNRNQIDVFSYENLTEKIKVQIVFIWRDFFKEIDEDFSKDIWHAIHEIICKEHGKKTLLKDTYGSTYYDSYRVQNYFEETKTIDENLDVVEIVFRLIEKTPEIYKNNYRNFKSYYTPDKAINDLNTRFLENGFGFEFQNGRIIRVDNKLLHKEIIVQTLQFLSSDDFTNANEEFLSAHMHYRHQRNKECLNDCLKAFETTMKVICKLNDWSYDENDTAKKLIDLCLKNKLIPTFLTSHFSALRTNLESGVPTLRNKMGGHGQGVNKIEVPNHFASYMLYLTGTSINFLVACQHDLKKTKEE